MPTLPIFYSDEYVKAAHPFDTTRKARWIADSLGQGPIPGVVLEAPAPLTEADLLQVHDAAYVTAVRTGEPRSLATSNGFDWDPGLWQMVLASNGGAVAAALRALETGGVAGSLSSGLHHARRANGKGFCTFNGLALAAKRALSAGARSVLILDLDAHCGGGTADILAGEPEVVQVDIAVSAFDCYRPRDGWILDVLGDAADYLPTLRRRLDSVDSAAFDLVIYNAGMDPFERCEIGGLDGITREVIDQRERMVFEWCRANRLPAAFVLAGGYINSGLSEEELVDLHRLTIAAAAAQPAA